MTREELIRNLKYTMKKHENNTVSTSGTNIPLMCKDVLDYLEQTRWISISERLPKEEDYRPCVENPDGAVWWKDSKGNIGLGWYYNSIKAWADLNDHAPKNEIVAWMRIPETESEDEY